MRPRTVQDPCLGWGARTPEDLHLPCCPHRPRGLRCAPEWLRGWGGSKASLSGASKTETVAGGHVSGLGCPYAWSCLSAT